MPETDNIGACIVAEEIKKNIEALNIPHEYSKVAPYVTLSLGVATIIPDKSKTINALIEEADKALYKAKSNGLNQSYCLKFSYVDLQQIME